MSLDFGVGYKSKENYKFESDLQKQLDNLQKEIVDNLQEKASQNNEFLNEKNNIIDINRLLNSIDHFQDLLENGEGNEELRKKYLKFLVLYIKSGNSPANISTKIESLLDTYSGQLDLKNSTKDLYVLTRKESRDISYNFQGRSEYRIGNILNSVGENINVDSFEKSFNNEFRNSLHHLDNFFKLTNDYIGVINNGNSSDISIFEKHKQMHKNGLEELKKALAAIDKKSNHLAKDLLKSQIYYNMHLVTGEYAKIIILSSLQKYFQDNDSDLLFKDLSKALSFLDESKKHLIRSDNFSGKHSQTDYSKIIILEPSIKSLINKIGTLKKPNLNRDGLIIDSFEQTFDNIVSKQSKPLITEQERKIMEKLGIFILGENDKNKNENRDAFSLVVEEKRRIKEQIDLINKKTDEIKKVISSLDNEILEIDKLNKDIKEKKAEIIDKIKKTQEAMIEETLTRIKNIVSLGRREAYVDTDSNKNGTNNNDKQTGGNGTSNNIKQIGGNGINSCKSNISEFNDDISFGFNDKINGHKREHFTIYPPIPNSLYPLEIISEFDSKTSKGKIVQKREKQSYTNTEIVEESKYIGKTSEKMTKIELPKDYTVNTSSLRLSENVFYDILRDKYGIHYLYLDIPEGQEIEFCIGIGKDEISDECILSEYEKKELTKPLYNGPYSSQTEKMFEEIRTNNELYSTTKEKVGKVGQFIQDKYLYVLDSSLNDEIKKYPNQVQAIENTYVELDGKKYHPAICNISARMAVAYLRELGIPSVVITGNSKLTNTEYVGHAWIRYYDAEDKKWIFYDPTPSKMGKEVKYEFYDPNSQEIYELNQKIKENETNRQDKKFQKKQKGIYLKKINSIKEKFENQQKFYNDDELVGKILSEGLHEVFIVWNNRFEELLLKYNSENDPEKKESIKKEFQNYVLKTFNKIKEVANNAVEYSKNGSSELYRRYFESNLMILEKLLEENPFIDSKEIEKIIEIYTKAYIDIQSREVYQGFGKLKSGAQLIIMNNILYLYDRNKSFKYEALFSLEGYHYISSKITEKADGTLIFIGKSKKNGVGEWVYLIKFPGKEKIEILGGIHNKDPYFKYYNEKTYYISDYNLETVVYGKINDKEIGKDILSNGREICDIDYINENSYGAITLEGTTKSWEGVIDGENVNFSGYDKSRNIFLHYIEKETYFISGHKQGKKTITGKLDSKDILNYLDFDRIYDILYDKDIIIVKGIRGGKHKCFAIKDKQEIVFEGLENEPRFVYHNKNTYLVFYGEGQIKTYKGKINGKEIGKDTSEVDYTDKDNYCIIQKKNGRWEVNGLHNCKKINGGTSNSFDGEPRIMGKIISGKINGEWKFLNLENGQIISTNQYGDDHPLIELYDKDDYVISYRTGQKNGVIGGLFEGKKIGEEVFTEFDKILSIHRDGNNYCVVGITNGKGKTLKGKLNGQEIHFSRYKTAYLNYYNGNNYRMEGHTETGEKLIEGVISGKKIGKLNNIIENHIIENGYRIIIKKGNSYDVEIHVGKNIITYSNFESVSGYCSEYYNENNYYIKGEKNGKEVVEGKQNGKDILLINIAPNKYRIFVNGVDISSKFKIFAKEFRGKKIILEDDTIFFIDIVDREQKETSMKNFENRVIIPLDEFIPRAKELKDKVKNGYELTEKDKIFLIQNYTGNLVNEFEPDSVYKDSELVTFLERLVQENTQILYDGRISNISKAMGRILLIKNLIKRNLSKWKKELDDFLNDPKVSPKFKVEIVFEALKIFFEQKDHIEIDFLLDRVKDSPWKESFLSKIETFTSGNILINKKVNESVGFGIKKVNEDGNEFTLVYNWNYIYNFFLTNHYNKPNF